MKQKLFLLIALLAGFAHCDKLFLIEKKTEIISASTTFGVSETTNKYLLLKDDSSYIRTDFLANGFGTLGLAHNAQKGRWAVRADSLDLIASKCYSSKWKCSPSNESYLFVGDSLHLKTSAGMDMIKDSVLIKRMENSESETVESTKSNERASVISWILVGVLLVGCIVALKS